MDSARWPPEDEKRRSYLARPFSVICKKSGKVLPQPLKLMCSVLYIKISSIECVCVCVVYFLLLPLVSYGQGFFDGSFGFQGIPSLIQDFASPLRIWCGIKIIRGILKKFHHIRDFSMDSLGPSVFRGSRKDFFLLLMWLLLVFPLLTKQFHFHRQEVIVFF